MNQEDIFMLIKEGKKKMIGNGKATPDDDQSACCKSCGVPFADHLGLQGTCAMLQETRKRSLAITPNVQAYLRIVAHIHVDGDIDDFESDEERNDAWDQLTKPERDTANVIVEAVFGEWL